MSESVAVEKIACACPHCGRKYRLPAKHIGTKGKCAGCQNVFEIQPSGDAPLPPMPPPRLPPPIPIAAHASMPPIPHAHIAAAPGAAAAATIARPVAPARPAVVARPALAATPAAGDAASVGVCPVCLSAALDAEVQCPDCHARHHKECWEYNGGCGKYGCTSAPEPAKLEELEVPLAYWGQTDKACPSCHQVIQAAALRCRHCGIVFNTARPQAQGEFHAQRAIEDDLPGLRKKALWLLVFSILPFTAALAAVIGGIWYLLKRKRIAALPAQQQAMARIALIIAIVQTVLLGIVALLHAVLV